MGQSTGFMDAHDEASIALRIARLARYDRRLVRKETKIEHEIRDILKGIVREVPKPEVFSDLQTKCAEFKKIAEEELDIDWAISKGAGVDLARNGKEIERLIGEVDHLATTFEIPVAIKDEITELLKIAHEHADKDLEHLRNVTVRVEHIQKVLWEIGSSQRKERKVYRLAVKLRSDEQQMHDSHIDLDKATSEHDINDIGKILHIMVHVLANTTEEEVEIQIDNAVVLERLGEDLIELRDLFRDIEHEHHDVIKDEPRNALDASKGDVNHALKKFYIVAHKIVDLTKWEEAKV